MLCDEVREHLSAYLDRELTADLSAAVRAHLDACAECRALADDLRATVDLLGRLPLRAAPEHLSDDVMREIERRGVLAIGSPIEPPPQERTLPMRRARLWPRALAVAATLALAIGIGIFAYLGEVGGPKAPAPASGVAEKAAEKWEEEGRDLSVAMAPKSPEISDDAYGRRMAPTASAAAGSRTDAGFGAFKDKRASGEKAAPLPAGTNERFVVPGRDLGTKMLGDRENKPVKEAVLAKTGSGTLTLANASAYGTLDFNGGSLGRTYDVDGDWTKVTSLNREALRYGNDAALEQLQVGNGTISGTMNLTGANTYTGATIVNGDSLIIQAPAALTSLSTGGLDGGTNNMYFGAQPAAAGSAGRAQGVGTITLNGTNTYGYSGGTVISAGVAMTPLKPPVPTDAPTAPTAELAAAKAAPPAMQDERPALTHALVAPAVELPAVTTAPARTQVATAQVAPPPKDMAALALPAAPAGPSPSEPATAARPAVKEGVANEKVALSDSEVTFSTKKRGKAAGHGTAADGSEALEQAMRAAARGEGEITKLSRAATHDALGRAGNQLVIQAESPAEADQGLVELFKAAGWQSLASDRSDRRAEPATPLAQEERAKQRPEPAAEKMLSEEIGQPAAAGMYYKPAATGMYYKAVRNGENVWLVLADRDSISRFGSRLAQARGLTVAAESSAEFRAIRGLQDQLRQSVELAGVNQPASRLARGKEVAGGDVAAAFARPPAPAKPPAGRPAGEADPSVAGDEGERFATKTAKGLDEVSKYAAKKPVLPPPSATPAAAERPTKSEAADRPDSVAAAARAAAEPLGADSSSQRKQHESVSKVGGGGAGGAAPPTGTAAASNAKTEVPAKADDLGDSRALGLAKARAAPMSAAVHADRILLVIRVQPMHADQAEAGKAAPAATAPAEKPGR